MKFEHDGKTYFLEFQRQKKVISINRKGTKIEEESRYPFTTAKLLVVTESPLPTKLYEHTVGCCPTDEYSNEKGRIEALRGVSQQIPKENKGLRKAMWGAYTGRFTIASK
jgi:hypothetical protein